MELICEILGSVVNNKRSSDAKKKRSLSTLVSRWCRNIVNRNLYHVRSIAEHSVDPQQNKRM
jgi:hypothetical protein